MTADDNNDAPQPAANSGSEGPSFSVLSQYVKDLSFERSPRP